MTKLNLFFTVVFASLLSMIPGLAAAAGADYSGLVSVVDASTIVTAIGAIAAVMFLPTVAKWGFRKVMSMLGR
ncbi:hypothetical protein HZU77_015820 [Neisseriaceae bacterium TC5R-5]|nr:hypothetical protein [Neisseriaceae bacterium TC5R-5]